MNEDEYTYMVTLDGDYAGEYKTLEEAIVAKKTAKGHIQPKDRNIYKIIPEQWIEIFVEENA